MKYIFKQIDNISGRFAETTVEFHADSLPDILEQFEMFLRGSGFHPSGVLDFVDVDECEEWHNEEFDTPQEEPVYTWNNTSATWPFPKSNPTEDVSKLGEEWYGVSPSTAMQWTVNELMKGPMTVQSNAEKCSVCGLSLETMKTQKCWDKFCPKGNDAY
jgi:hypothetical protein